MTNIFEEDKESYRKFFSELPIELKNYLGLNVTLSKVKYKSMVECKKDLNTYVTSLIRIELQKYYTVCPNIHRYVVSELLKFVDEGGEFSYITYIADNPIEKMVMALWKSKNRKGKKYSYNSSEGDHAPATVHVDIENL